MDLRTRPAPPRPQVPEPGPPYPAVIRVATVRTGPWTPNPHLGGTARLAVRASPWDSLDSHIPPGASGRPLLELRSVPRRVWRIEPQNAERRGSVVGVLPHLAGDSVPPDPRDADRFSRRTVKGVDTWSGVSLRTPPRWGRGSLESSAETVWTVDRRPSGRRSFGVETCRHGSGLPTHLPLAPTQGPSSSRRGDPSHGHKDPQTSQ